MGKDLIIKITGSGSREDIASSLQNIIYGIQSTPIEELDGSEWEDGILMTYIIEME